MSDDWDPDQNPKLRRFAELEVERQSSGIDRLLDQHVADFKWITASLLLLNSGAVAAVLNSSAVSNQGKLFSGSFYLLGIGIALIIGIASQRFAMKVLPPTIGYRAFWIAVSQGDVFDPDEERKAVEKVQSAAKFAWLVPALGWLSGLAFLSGSVLAGKNLVEVPAKAEVHVRVPG